MKKRKYVSRILAFLLTLCMMLSMMPVTTRAEEPSNTGEVKTTDSNTTLSYKLVHLDCGRKYFSKEWIIALINEMSAAGYNQLQLDFSNNEGLRFALNDMTVNGIDLSSAVGPNGEYGDGYLTQSDMDEIIDHANSKGIEIVPSMDMPGHMGAILNAVSRYKWQNSNSLDIESEEAVNFALALLRKYVDYFSGKGCKYFNIGADEFANDIYSTGGMGFAALQTQGKYNYFVDFVNKAAAVVKEAGMIPRAWNDGLYYNDADVTFDTDIQVYYWSSGGSGYNVASASTIAAKGHDMINANGNYYYVLGKSCNGGNAEYCSTFDNTAFMGDTVSNPAGAMFCIWCDYPNAQTETEVASNIWSSLRMMAARMNGQTTYSQELVEGGFNTDGTICEETVGNTTDIFVNEKNEGLQNVDVESGESTTIKLNITDTQSVTVSSNNEQVATVSVDGKDLVIEGKEIGTAVITATVSSNSRSVEDGTTATLTVNVTEKSDDNDPSIEEPAEGQIKSETIASSCVLDTDGLDSDAQYLIVYKESADATSGKALTVNKTAQDVTVDGNNVTSEVVDDSSLWSYSSVNSKEYLMNGTKYLYPNRKTSGNFWNPTYSYSLNIDTNQTRVLIKNNENGIYTIGDYNNSIFSTYSNCYVIYKSNAFTADESSQTLYFYKYTSGKTEYVVNSSPLEKLVADLKALNLDENIYSEESWSAYTTALATAEEELSNATEPYSSQDDATIKQNALNSAANKLYAAYQGLQTAVIITVNYVDGSGNVLSMATYRYAPNATYSITPETITVDDKCYEPVDSTVLTGTAAENTTLTVVCTECEKAPDNALSTDTLTIEYWITNARVYTGQSGRGENSSVLNKTDSAVQSIEGIALNEILPEITYKSDSNKELKYWRTRILNKETEEQTTVDGDDETLSGNAAKYIRYYNNAWQYSDNRTDWTYVETNSQIVAYYMVKTQLATEAEVTASDWGYYDNEQWGYNINFNLCSLSVQVVYEDGTTVPSGTTADALAYSNSPYTMIYGYWENGRGIGTLNIAETGDYSIWKVTSETGAMTNTISNNNKVDITGFAWDDNETTVWEGEDSSGGVIINNNAQEPSKDGYYNNLMWDEANESILIRIYVKAKPKESNLKVYYREGTPESYTPIYDYQINVDDQHTPNTFDGFATTGSATDKSLALTNNTITNALGQPQTVQYDLTQLKEVGDKYSSGYYTFTQMEKNAESGSTELYLYYTAGASDYTYVVDYGLPLEIRIADLKLENASQFQLDSTRGTYGTFTLNEAKDTLTYTLNKMIEGRESVQIGIKYKDETTEEIQIVIIPATTVYYEDNFVNYTNSTQTSTEGNGIWAVEGATKTETQALDKLGDTSANIYGYDSAYDQCTTYSMGSAEKVTVDTETGSKSTRPYAQFTFTGTGFDLISLTDNNSGLIKVTVADTTGNVVKTISVDNYYGYSYDAKSDTWTETDNAVSNALYQVPVVQITGLEKAKYTVTVEVMYLGSLDDTGDNQYSFWLDAVRIYDPAGTTLNAEYEKDGEQDPDYKELRDILLEANSLSEEAQEGVVFIDGNTSAGITDYENYGPNNEVYLLQGQAISFKVIADKNPQEVQIGAKLAQGTSADLYLNGNLFQTLNSATDRNYVLTNLTWRKSADGTYTSNTVVLSNNTEGAIVSLTNLKAIDATFATVSEVQEASNSNISSAKARMAVMSTYSMAEEAVAILQTSEKVIFVPESVEVKWSSNVKAGKTAILTIQTSQDVESVSVNGTVITDYKTKKITTGFFKNRQTITKRVWTYTITAPEKGNYDYSVIAFDVNGNESEPITAMLEVKGSILDRLFLWFL